MTTTLNRNGQGRKSLGEQIDRLDQILTGLADALNDSIGQAVRDAVGAAVQATLAEALANPELRVRIAAGRGTGTALHRLLARARQAVRTVTTAIQTFGTTTSAVTVRVMRTARTAARGWMTAVWRLRRPVLLALGLGGVVAVACYWAGPLVASAVSGVASAAEFLTARVRRLGETPPPASGRPQRVPGLPAGGFRGRFQPGQVM